MRKTHLEWSYVQEAVDDIALSIKNSRIKLTGIYGIPRGGLIPAVMLSHRLGLPMVRTLDSDILIVDDICDTGNTLKHYMSIGLPVATLQYKQTAVVEPTFWYSKASEDIWYVYPWETKDSKTIQDYKVC